MYLLLDSLGLWVSKKMPLCLKIRVDGEGRLFLGPCCHLILGLMDSLLSPSHRE